MIQTLFGSTEEKPSFLKRMKEAVTRTRESLSERIDDVVAFRKEIDRETLDELEATLISADLGTATTATILDALSARPPADAGRRCGNLSANGGMFSECASHVANAA